MTKYRKRPEYVLEEKLWILGRMLGFEVIELGHRVRQRAPDGAYIARRERYAIIFDAKARKEPYVIGTDDRRIIEYVEQYSRKFDKEGTKNVYYIIVSADFADDNQSAIRRIERNTTAKGICLLPAYVLLYLLELKLKEPRITLAEIEEFLLDARGMVGVPAEDWKEIVQESLGVQRMSGLKSRKLKRKKIHSRIGIV